MVQGSAITIIILVLLSIYPERISSQCTFNFDALPVTNFKSGAIETNIFGFSQGLGNGGSAILQNDSLRLVFDNSSNFYQTNLCPLASQDCFSLTSYQAVGLTITNMDRALLAPNNDPLFYLTLKSSSYWDEYQLRGQHFAIDHKTGQGIFYEKLHVNSPITSMELRVDGKRLASKPFLLKEISLVTVTGVCSTSNGLEKDKGFVWRKGSVLMLGNMPYRFIGFYVHKIHMLNRRELEDLVKTVAIFADGGSKVIKIHSFMSVIGDGNQCGTKDECFITKPNEYNENFLESIDHLLDVCRKYGVKVIIPFVTTSYEFSAFAVLYRFGSDQFYTNKQVMEKFFWYVNLIVNRNNTVNGILYRDDNTILAWETGTELEVNDVPPPLSWLIEMASYIKSIDPNHMVVDSVTESINIYNFNNPYADMTSISASWASEYRSYTARFVDMVRMFKRPFFFDRFPMYRPDILQRGLQEFFEAIIDPPYGFETSDIAGIFIKLLAGRKEGVGFNAVIEELDRRGIIGIHYPGFDVDEMTFDLLDGSPREKMNIVVKFAYHLKKIYDNEGDYVDSPGMFYPTLDPPTILQTSVKGRIVEISYFGAVGATKYRLYRSSGNPNNMSILLDDIFEWEKVVVRDESKENAQFQCSTLIYYEMESIREDVSYKATSSRNSFQVLIPIQNEPDYCKIKETQSTLGSGNISSGSGIVLILSVAGVVLGFMAAMVFFYYFKASRHKSKWIGDRTPSLKVVTENAISETYSLTQRKHVLAVPGYLLLNFHKDLALNPDETGNNNLRGQGLTSKVIKGRLLDARLVAKHGNIPIAIKLMNDSGAEADYLYELSIMSMFISCPYIVQLIGYCDQPRAIIMKHYPISLKVLLKSSDFKSSPVICIKIGYDVAQGMNLIHKSGVIHLDLKPHNILVDIMPDGSFMCVICDFGFSNVIGSESDKFQAVTGLLVPQSAGLTARYASPELFQQIEHIENRFNREEDKKIDVYAFAVTFFEIAFGVNAWEGLDYPEIRAKVLNGERPLISEKMIEPFKDYLITMDLTKRCWDQVPQQRPDFEYISKVFEKVLESTGNITIDSSNDSHTLRSN